MPAPEILIVDDELGIRNLLTTVLKGEGYAVREAENGQEAIDAVKESLPDLILCDIKMPVKDGIQTLKEIREISQDVSIMMLTAHGTVETAVQAMKLGASDYLRKPFDVEELKAKISREIDHADVRKVNRHFQDTTVKIPAPYTHTCVFRIEYIKYLPHGLFRVINTGIIIDKRCQAHSCPVIALASYRHDRPGIKSGL